MLIMFFRSSGTLFRGKTWLIHLYLLMSRTIRHFRHSLSTGSILSWCTTWKEWFNIDIDIWYGYDDIILNNQYYTSNNINININIDIISISISNTWIWTKKCGGSERKQHDSIISIRCLHTCFNFDLRPRYQSSAATFSFRIRVTSLYFPWAEA